MKTSKHIGKKYGKLLVLEKTFKNEIVHFKCLCECGTIWLVSNKNLSKTKSCGCLITDVLIERNTKHGLCSSHKRAFNVWNNMVQRCHNPKHPRYYDWGGRGIKVCVEWRNFENFLRDMGDSPKGLEIDRRNNNEGYYKQNCRWVTKAINMSNRRNSKYQDQANEPVPAKTEGT